MSTVEEHFAILRGIRRQPTDWLTDRYHRSAAIFLAAHLDELEAAWKVAHPSESGAEPTAPSSLALTAEQHRLRSIAVRNCPSCGATFGHATECEFADPPRGTEAPQVERESSRDELKPESPPNE